MVQCAIKRRAYEPRRSLAGLFSGGDAEATFKKGTVPQARPSLVSLFAPVQADEPPQSGDAGAAAPPAPPR